MKIRTVLVGVELQPDHPKTPVIHKVGGYGSGSDISRGLYALADTWDAGHAGPTSLFTKLCGIRQKPEMAKRIMRRSASGALGARPGGFVVSCSPPIYVLLLG